MSQQIMLGTIALIVSIVGSVFMLIITSTIAFVTVRVNQRHSKEVFEKYTVDTDHKIATIKNVMFTSDGGTNFVRQVECGRQHNEMTTVINAHVSDQKAIERELSELKAEIKVFAATASEQTNTIQALRLAVVDSTSSQNLIAQELSKLPAMLLPSLTGRRTFKDLFTTAA